MSPRRSVRSISAVVAVLVLSAPGNADPPFFMPLGDLPGGTVSSQAFAVSADGLVVVGTSSSASGVEAFRWTQAGGIVGLGDLPGGIFNSEATSVSADGSVVVVARRDDDGQIGGILRHAALRQNRTGPRKSAIRRKVPGAHRETVFDRAGWLRRARPASRARQNAWCKAYRSRRLAGSFAVGLVGSLNG